MSTSSPKIELLHQFRPLDKLSEKQLILLSANSELRSYETGEIILALASEDNLAYYLAEGEVELESFDGRQKQISARTESSATAIALLQPRKYTVRALSNCQFVVIPQPVIDALLAELPQNKTVEFSARDVHSGHEIEDIEASFLADLKTNNIELPSFPDVAMRIRHLLDDPNVTAKDIADAIKSDPAITVKILKTCNSAVYHTASEITSCQDAVVRLGFETTRQLVNIFVLKELFQSKNHYLQEKMSELWSHSREVATIAYVLAEITPGMNPELAMLAGLIQDIGTVPVLEYVERYPQFMKVEHKVDEIVRSLRARIGARLLEEWGFKQELVEVARHSEDWMYASQGDTADYVDIAVVAQVHALIGKKKHAGLPPFDQIPAFRKLGKDGLTPEQSQKVLLESHQKIAELKALLTTKDIPVVGG